MAPGEQVHLKNVLPQTRHNQSTRSSLFAQVNSRPRFRITRGSIQLETSVLLKSPPRSPRSGTEGSSRISIILGNLYRAQGQEPPGRRMPHLTLTSYSQIRRMGVFEQAITLPNFRRTRFLWHRHLAVGMAESAPMNESPNRIRLHVTPRILDHLERLPTRWLLLFSTFGRKSSRP